ncbi:MAG: oxygen-dependent coproporphyrinogen oxidase [Myxococcota bacterium]
MRERAQRTVEDLQDTLCEALERLDGEGVFRQTLWERPGGGGGRTRVLEEGGLFEKAGVNVSTVHGQLPEALADKLEGDATEFWATGVSLVLHPRNPHVPTAHANFRYIERGDTGWFGGGADLTPWILYEDDVRHFHEVLGEACDRHDPAFYPRFKAWCDEYFYLEHREEARGVGGLFFDYLKPDARHDLDSLYAWWSDVGRAFLPAYQPIVERRRDTKWTEAQRRWQLQRRGRYVEFNLVYDRGTLFGLKTKGRIESILMSMPPLVRWDYDVQPEPGTPEARLIEILREPRDWR